MAKFSKHSKSSVARRQIEKMEDCIGSVFQVASFSFQPALNHEHNLHLNEDVWRQGDCRVKIEQQRAFEEG
jgi:hypothetical protein